MNDGRDLSEKNKSLPQVGSKGELSSKVQTEV